MNAARRPRNRRTPRINFGNGTWTAVSVAFDEATLDNPLACLEVRVMAAARARIDPTGHSHWRRGELRSRLVTVTADGLVPVHRNSVAACIGRLVQWGILARGSNAMCLVYVPFAVQTGITNGTWPPCPRRAEDS